VVIAIIGILATISVIGLSTVRAKSRDTKRVADVKQMQTAMGLFFNDMHRYPTEDEFAAGSLFSTSSGQAAVYMAVIPSAPTPADGACTSGDNAYSYLVSPDYSNYRIDFCTGGRIGSIEGGLEAGTPAGFARLDQGVFIDEAMAGVQVVGLESGRSIARSDDIVYRTSAIGQYKVPLGTTAKLLFYSDRDFKVKLGEINRAKVAADNVVTLAEIDPAIMDKYKDDVVKARDASINETDVVNKARFIAAISEPSPVFGSGRNISDANIVKLKDWMAKNKITALDDSNFKEALAAMEQDGVLTFVKSEDAVKVMADTMKAVSKGYYTPTRDNIQKLEASFKASPESQKLLEPQLLQQQQMKLQIDPSQKVMKK